MMLFDSETHLMNPKFLGNNTPRLGKKKTLASDAWDEAKRLNGKA